MSASWSRPAVLKSSFFKKSPLPDTRGGIFYGSGWVFYSRFWWMWLDNNRPRQVVYELLQAVFQDILRKLQFSNRKFDFLFQNLQQVSAINNGRFPSRRRHDHLKSPSWRKPKLRSHSAGILAFYLKSGSSSSSYLRRTRVYPTYCLFRLIQPLRLTVPR